MKVGDLIRFTSTGCMCLVVKISKDDHVHVLCGDDADGEDAGRSAFPRFYLTSVAEVINASR